jgi:hypothetical protein
MITNFDTDFEEIKKLQWFPWIGKNYSKNGLLILGESHYEDGDEWQKGNKLTSRIITQKRYENIKGKWDLHRNVEKTVLNTDEISEVQRRNFYDNISYFNLVQRLLDSRKRDHRPTDDDFDEGWEVFFDVIEILEPRFVLVLGKASYGRLGFYLNNSQENWIKEENDSNPNEKIFNLKKNDKRVKILFINHPSGSWGFDYKKWALLVEEEFKDEKKGLMI